MANTHNYLGTDPNYWDCNCDVNYIHPKSEHECELCGADADFQPDSMINEVAEMQATK